MSPARKGRGAARNRQPRQSASQQRQRLIDACISALHLYGPSRTTVAKVVAIAKLSPGIVRFYFNSKGAMLVASLRFLAAEFEQRVLEPVGQLRDTPALALQKLIELYLDPEIASARKVSVWYAFWGESTARREYQEICGQKDERFAILVHELIGRMIGESGQRHLNSDAIALGLIGALEVLWQGFTFQAEDDIDRAGARRRCLAYLASVFPGYFPAPAAGGDWRRLPDEARHALEKRACFAGAWQLVGRGHELAASGDFLTIELAAARVLLVRDGAELRALHNSCPHQPHALIDARRGRLPGHVACTLHGLDFSLDGRPRGNSAGAALATLAVASPGGFVFAGNGATPPPVLEFDRDTVAGRGLSAGTFSEHVLECDWKLLVEQLLLHRLPDRAPGAHAPDAPPVLAVDAALRELRWRGASGQGGWTAQRLRTLAPTALEWRRQFTWPNLLVEWRDDGCQALQVVPLESGRCRLQAFDYARQDSAAQPQAVRYLARRLARRLLQLDTTLAVSTQAGLRVHAYAPGIDAPVPRAVAKFRDWLAAALESR